LQLSELEAITPAFITKLIVKAYSILSSFPSILSIDSCMTRSIRKYFGPLIAVLQSSLPKLLSPAPLASALTMSKVSNNNVDSKPCHVRVASYNVLSSHLASPSYFSSLNSNHLLANNRLPIILQKLDQEMEQKAILCLQEVSHMWAGALHRQCCENGYHFVTGFYGKKFDGYMGVGIALPQEKYKLIDVDIVRYV
jgi:hypothetical protein